MIENAKKETVLHFVNKLVEYICKINPVAGFVYDSVGKLVCDDMPEGVDFMTDGSVLFIRDDIVLDKNSNLQYVGDRISFLSRKLSHELMHIMLGHPGNAGNVERCRYDADCDEEISRYSDFSVKRWSFGMYAYAQGDISHGLWYLNAMNEELMNFLNNHLQELKEILARLETRAKSLGNDSDAESDTGDMFVEVSNDTELSDTMRLLKKISEDKCAEFKDIMYGLSSGSGGEVISHIRSECVNFEDELKRYVTISEQSCDTDDELDYVMYTYGLSMYGNIPIVEPPEETERLSASFYLAIDCSGSIDKALAERFLGQVREIVLKAVNDDRNSVDIDLYIFDSQVTQSFHIEKTEDFPEIQDIVLTWGGTDFVPLIEKVSEMVEKKGQTNTALFCFSDGCGRFPQQKPNFDVFFVMEEQNDLPSRTNTIPDWVGVLKL